MYGDAETFLGRALALGPKLIEAYFELGRARWFAGNPDGARQAWRDGARGQVQSMGIDDAPRCSRKSMAGARPRAECVARCRADATANGQIPLGLQRA